ncbi:MAG: hypothetical protein QM725_18010 [Lacibacter sp.]
MNFIKILLRLFNYKRTNPLLTNLTSQKSFEEKYNDWGAFNYTQNGFSIKYEDFFKEVKWNDITQLNVYKKDLMTIDRIEMEIVYGNMCITINEDIPGWYQFVVKTKSIFPEIPEEWNFEITDPPFARNYRTIYKKIP